MTLCILGLLVACFGLAVLLDLTTSASLLDAYLATTPGGLYAVLAVAFGAGANTTFIVAVQGLRAARHGPARAGDGAVADPARGMRPALDAAWRNATCEDVKCDRRVVRSRRRRASSTIPCP